MRAAEQHEFEVKFLVRLPADAQQQVWPPASPYPARSRQDSPISKRVQGEVQYMAIPATQMRPGMIIKHNNDLHLVFTVEHRTPGNLRAFIQAKLRNIRTGAMVEHRFRSSDPIEKITVDEIPMEFLYQDGDSYCFMNTE